MEPGIPNGAETSKDLGAKSCRPPDSGPDDGHAIGQQVELGDDHLSGGDPDDADGDREEEGLAIRSISRTQ